jgi:hypothetical protein
VVDKTPSSLQRHHRTRRPLLGARSAVGRRSNPTCRPCPCLASNQIGGRGARPDAVSAPRTFRSRVRHLRGKLGRVPLALGSLLIGALIPWTVGAYAPMVIEKARAVPIVETTGGIDAAAISTSWMMAMAAEAGPAELPATVESCSDLRRWLTQQGASDVETTWLRLSFRGTRLSPVTVTGIQVIIDEESRPSLWIFIRLPIGGLSKQ